MTPMSVGDPDTADPPRRPTVTPGEAPRDAQEHGRGGMDAIEEAPVREPDDDDAPGGMTGIPDPEDA